VRVQRVDAQLGCRVLDGGGDDQVPVEQVEPWLAYLTVIGRSPTTVKG
jgi:hypothetical protein